MIMHFGEVIMMSTVAGLSPCEAELLTRLSVEDRRVFRLVDIADGRPDATAARRVLSWLERDGGGSSGLNVGLYMLVPQSLSKASSVNMGMMCALCCPSNNLLHI
jgi:hypothetical protein